MLTPPIDLVRPVKVASLPHGPPKSWIFQSKVDGWRAAAFITTAQVRLQARSGRDVTGHFPEITAPLWSLPPDTVLDGEVVAVRRGTFEFEALARSPAWRRQHGVAIGYQAFDLLAFDGADWRGRPLSERWAALVDLLAAAPANVQPVLSTTDRTEAISWMAALRSHGIEGLVGKPTSSTYGPLHGWVKLRDSDTIHADVLSVLGVPRPRALRVRLEDGRVAVTEPLGSVGARAVERALTESGLPLQIEVRAGIGRHTQVRFIRVRPPE